MSIAEIESMTNAERLAAMDNLWQVLTSSKEEVESPAWHEGILEERIKKIDSGEAKFYSLEEVEQHFKDAK